MIYLDYAATTPVDKKVIKALEPYLNKEFGNPSSIHYFGRQAQSALIEARNTWAEFFGIPSSGIIFTSSATESNNLAIRGFFEYLKIKNQLSDLKNFHAITSAIEHKSVLETFKDLSKNQGLEVTFIKPLSDGIINPQDIKNAVKKNTVLVSIMYVNNEIGSVQPITQIAKEISNLKSKIQNLTKTKSENEIINQYPLIHSDCVQAVQFYPCNMKELGIDFATASSHKIYGPKGVGILAALNPKIIKPLLTGGNQEDGLRAGTENVAAIVGAAQALKIIQKEQKSNFVKIQKLKNKLLDGIIKIYPKGKVNGSTALSCPHILNYCFKGLDSHSLLIMLDLEGIAVSIGSACNAGAIEPSHVLTAIGLSEKDSLSSLRFSLGKFTTQKEIDHTLKVLSKILSKTKPSNF